MPSEGLTGSRIRERRSVAGLRQVDLARSLGISASYLNLIEHNRRRIGGKLLLDIARTLGVEPSMLTEGAEAALMATLREAATQAGLSAEEAGRADEFAGRFPGWAEVVASAHRRIETLERTVETLNDRLTHDPELASSVHELLSMAAAIRSTASILADEKDLEADWLDRFHANLNEDSLRLAESSRALVEYFEAARRPEGASAGPQDDVDSFLDDNDWRFETLETGAETPEDIAAKAPALRQDASRALATTLLRRIAEDAGQVSLQALEMAMAETGPDPVALARRMNLPVPLIMRRMASLPGGVCGLVVCDRAGSILYRKPAGQMVIPRFAAACPLWPLFSALSHPGQVLRVPLVQLGRGRAAFDCFAVCEAVGAPQYNQPPLLQSTMLLVPDSRPPADGALEVGSTCRVCPAENCPGRREPSILSEAVSGPVI